MKYRDREDDMLPLNLDESILLFIQIGKFFFKKRERKENWWEGQYYHGKAIRAFFIHRTSKGIFPLKSSFIYFLYDL